MRQFYVGRFAPVSRRRRHISPGTVRKHREHLFAKLETSNTAHLTLIAVRRGIVVG